MTAVTERGRPADVALGRAIHHYMWDRKITQTKLAAMIGMDQGELSKKIHGKRRWWFSEMIDVADALQVNAVELLTGLWGPDESPLVVPAAAPSASINFHGRRAYSEVEAAQCETRPLRSVA